VSDSIRQLNADTVSTGHSHLHVLRRDRVKKTVQYASGEVPQ
jgi:hypothetical protein